ncbi:hypothetical protein [Bradyrhizobium sp. SZCCHNRI3052]|nr:hypothetical protein [Bradyrhizobium sp. SZCCHNRI3052]
MFMLLMDLHRDRKLRDAMSDGDIAGSIVPLVTTCVVIIACCVWVT